MIFHSKKGESTNHGKKFKVTGTCAMHQRAVAKAIKRARVVAILPFDADQ